ncbi:MAG: glycosyltransferase family 2 protein [Actinomycetota bacterium]
MTTPPLVSIILPTHNRADRLPAAIRSASAQTLRNIEIVVVDDGSADATPAVVEALAADDRRIRYLRKPQASGAARARNHGITHANGEFIAFLDDDDMWHPTKMERQVGYLTEHPDVGAVSCHYRIVFEGKQRITVWKGPTRLSARGLLWNDFAGGASFIALRRSAFDESIVRFDERLPPCEDWDLWFRLAEKRRFDVVPEPLCTYVYHGSQALTGTREKLRDGHVRFIEKHRAEMSEACLAYHEAKLQLIGAESQRERLALHRRFLFELPRKVRSIVAAESLAARIGWVIGDPAIGARRLWRMIEKQERPT